MRKTMRLNVGILGATGVIGEEYIRLLKDHPYFNITFLAGSEKRVGTHSHLGLPFFSLHDIEEAKKSVSLIFSALPNSIAETIEPSFAEAGFPLISHASCHRMKKEVPLIIPEINPEHLQLIKKGKGFILAKPNCALNSFLLPLAPLHHAFGLKSASITTLQSISGAGKESLSALDIHDNIIPFIAGEEEKLEKEPLKILKDDSINFSVHCNRVPTLHGHMTCVSASFVQKPKMEEILTLWNQFAPLNLPSSPKPLLSYINEETRPQIRLDLFRGNGMGVTIGRLRPCPLFDYRFVALSHNAIRGGAGGGILLGELLYQKGML